MKRRYLLAALLSTLPHFCLAVEPLTLGGVSLLQPESDIQPRVRSVEELSSYIKSIQSASSKFFKNHPSIQSSSGYIVVAVKPVQQSNVWFDFTPKLPGEVAMQLSKDIRRLLPMRVTQGPVVFALQVGVNGAKPPSGPMPRPEEWAAEAGKVGHPIETSEMVLRLWQP